MTNLPKYGRQPSPVQETTWKVAPTLMPDAPEDLGVEARIEWDRIEPYLVALNRVSAIDKQPLTAYCMMWGTFSRLMKEHFADGEVSLAVDGSQCEVVHPLLPDLLRYASLLLELAAEFGLTARSRDLDGDDPRKLPSAIKRLMGNRKKVAEDKIPSSVVPMLPQWQDSDLEPPYWMNERSKRMYTLLGKELQAIDLFTPIDKIHICALCCLEDLLLRAHDQIHSDYTDIYDKKTGDVKYQKAHPLHHVIQMIVKVQKNYWSAYGMTPRSRKIFDGEKPVETKQRPILFTGRSG